jgi:uncharacterized protein (TIGR02284 family)
MAQGLNTLETLADTTIDSALGYRKAADQATNANLSQTLRQKGDERFQMANKLNAEIGRLGGKPREDGSFSGSAHRAWTDLTTAFGDKNESAVERVEEGEDYIAGKFSAALDDGDFDAQSRQVVQECCNQIQADEAFADQLKRQFD